MDSASVRLPLPSMSMSRDVQVTVTPSGAMGAEPDDRVVAVPELSRWVLIVAVLLFAELMAFAGRYGFHGDEMYFIVAGSHPAFGYPDQPPIVPLVAAAMHGLSHSLFLLRLPSALVAAAVVIVAGATAREVGGAARAQMIAACCAAVSAIALATGHFVTTTTFDLLSTALVGWLLVRATMRHDPRPLLWAGVVVGIGLEAKPQVAFVAAVAVTALGILGPRWMFRSTHFWIGVCIALVLAAPYLIWQQRHGWPQTTVAGNVAGSAEGGRLGFVPFQLVLVSPVLVPVWIAGLVSAWRNPALRPVRFVPLLYGLLVVAYLIGDGKAYYLASIYPTLLGIGAVSSAAWLDRGVRHWLRWSLLGTAVALSALISGVVALPLLPASKLPGSGTIALNPDIGNEVGWPQFIDTMSTVWHELPPDTRPHAVIFTGSYSEASAINVLGGSAGLPHAYSGHNAYSLWSEPRPDQTTTILVGFDSAQDAGGYFTGCQVVAHISNPVGLDNDEYGDPVLQCSGLTAPWGQIWPHLRHDN